LGERLAGVAIVRFEEGVQGLVVALASTEDAMSFDAAGEGEEVTLAVRALFVEGHGLLLGWSLAGGLAGRNKRFGYRTL
jgi:hypothetical protein